MDGTYSSKYDSAPATEAHIHRVRELMGDAIADLAARAQAHDASKFSEEEKPAFDRGTPALKEFTYGTPEYFEAFKTYGMEESVRHHYEQNSHHPEHYAIILQGETPDEQMVKNGTAVSFMSLLDLVEMLIDWKASSERMADGGDILKSIKINTERFGLSPQLATILARTVEEFGWVEKIELVADAGE